VDKDAIDRISRRLSAGSSRRGVVNSVLGGVAALLTGTAILKAEPGSNGKSAGKGRGKSTGKGRGKRTGKAKGKAWLCHQPDPITGLGGTVIQVAVSAKGGQNRQSKDRGHLGHGDVECPVQAQAYRKGGPCTVSGGVATC
jgi:hypothetical protein